MKHTIDLQPVQPDPKSDKDLDRIRSEFEHAMNAPSPNPRYGGLTPAEAMTRLVKPRPDAGLAR